MFVSIKNTCLSVRKGRRKRDNLPVFLPYCTYLIDLPVERNAAVVCRSRKPSEHLKIKKSVAAKVDLDLD